MKSISLLTLVAVAFGLGACAHKEAKPSSTSTVSKNVKGFKK